MATFRRSCFLFSTAGPGQSNGLPPAPSCNWSWSYLQVMKGTKRRFVCEGNAKNGNKVKKNQLLTVYDFCVLLGEELWRIPDKQLLSQPVICYNATRVRCACAKLSTFHVAWRKNIDSQTGQPKIRATKPQHQRENPNYGTFASKDFNLGLQLEQFFLR